MRNNNLAFQFNRATSLLNTRHWDEMNKSSVLVCTEDYLGWHGRSLARQLLSVRLASLLWSLFSTDINLTGLMSTALAFPLWEVIRTHSFVISSLILPFLSSGCINPQPCPHVAEHGPGPRGGEDAKRHKHALRERSEYSVSLLGLYWKPLEKYAFSPMPLKVPSGWSYPREESPGFSSVAS